MTEESNLAFHAGKSANIIKSLSDLYGLSLQEAADIYYQSDTSELLFGRNIKSLVNNKSTKVIAMTKGNEKKRSVRIRFGISFSPKNHRLDRNHCRDRSLFFSLP